MATIKPGRIALIFTTLFLFAAMTALSILNKYFGKDLGIFHRSTGDVSRRYPLMITPPWPIYFIWYIVFALELVLILYGITTICRKTKGGRSIYLLSLTPPRIYGLLVANNLAVVLWLYLWNWEYTVASFIIVFTLPVTMYISFYTSLKQLFNNFAVLIQEDTQSEIWVVRFLVQNSLGFISAWQTIVMFMNLGVVLRYEVGISDEIIFLALIGAMALLELAWFWLDVFVFDRYTRYILLPYIPWLAICCGLIWKLQSLFDEWGRDTITLFCCSVLALLCITVKIIFLIFRHKKSNMKKNVDKSIEDKTEKTDDEKNTELKNKTCVTFAVENEQVNTANENQKSGSENDLESSKGPLQCPLVPASEVQYNRIEMQEQAADATNTVIVHSDAVESNAIEAIPTTSGPPKQEVPMEESYLDNNSVAVEKEENDKVEQAELPEENSTPETAEDDVLQPDVLEERIEEPIDEESEENTLEVQPEGETVPCHTKEKTIQETVPEQEEVQSKLNPSEQVSDDIECANQPENLIDVDEQESLAPNQSEFVIESSIPSDLNSLDQISKENERESRPIDNESVNSTTAQVDDPMEDFDVENEPVDEEPELNQTPPPLLEDEEYEGTYIVREPGIDDEYQYDPSEIENDQQDPVPDDTLPSPPMSPDSDTLPSPPTAPVSDGEEYDESDGEEAPPVPPQDYNMPNKSYQIPSEPVESQPITTNGYSEQRRPESFGTVDTAV
ncbi:probable serine/threonine-protein kinase kinX [Saccostrea echinata]|uniref:probable serine/threonine-protein kinase kinX n=1 Tax=Saccostrea echinata TaxID=191078 RepID=UPI002A8394A5|nr:probable serine/threonine-protein kinase kinX [Saccostrea echinata]